MNTTLLLAYWRDRLNLVMVWLVLAVSLIATVVASFLSPEPRVESVSTLPVLAFAVGMIGRDVSAGTLPLLFTRPVRRFEYVLSRWTAAWLAASAFGLLEIAVRVAIVLGRHMTTSPSDVGAAAFDVVALAFGLSAVFAVLSSLVKGLGDFGIWILLQIMLPIGVKAGLPDKVSEIGQKFLMPQVTWAQVITLPADWPNFGYYVASIVLSLGFAILVMEYKELSYASSSA